MHLRYCMPRVRRKGYGLGNEIVPWARAYLASQVLGARLLPPSFGLNRREYWRHFRSAPDDWIYHRALEHLLPVVEFGEADYLQHGGGDVVEALRSFAAANELQRRSAYLLVTDGLWGGWHHIRAAREFVRATLYQSRFAGRNLLRLRQRIDPDKVLVGMHVRLGDFKPAQSPDAYRCVPNMALPLEWFQNVARNLRQALGDQVQFLLITDGSPQQLQPLLDMVPCITTGDMADSDCSDALALASCDLLVCSVSTYSVLAAFLSDAPYLWFEPNLFQHPQGCYSLGDPLEDGGRADSPRQRALHDLEQAPRAPRTRGIPVGVDGILPPALGEALLQHRALQRWQVDLVRGGMALPWST